MLIIKMMEMITTGARALARLGTEESGEHVACLN